MNKPTIAVSTATSRALEDERKLKRPMSARERRQAYGTLETAESAGEKLPGGVDVMAFSIGALGGREKLMASLGKKVMSAVHEGGVQKGVETAVASGAGASYLKKLAGFMDDLLVQYQQELEGKELETLDRVVTALRDAVRIVEKKPSGWSKWGSETSGGRW